jgi:hypothetical protein
VKGPQVKQSAPPPASPDMPLSRGQASITGNRRTALTAKFYQPDAIPQIVGLAKDSNGNVFKMTFNAVGAS